MNHLPSTPVLARPLSARLMTPSSVPMPTLLTDRPVLQMFSDRGATPMSSRPPPSHRVVTHRTSGKKLRKNIMFLGNPGVGKSTLLNAFCGAVWFKSGVSFGRGLTSRLDVHEVGDTIYYDTPGLADTQQREAAAEAIEQALKQSGEYKIIFVITLESGRVKAQDVATIDLVLRACPIIAENYGIIINKVPEKLYEQANANLNSICASIFCAVQATLFVHINCLDDRLDDKSDVLLDPPLALKKFVETVPSIDIPPPEVSPIDLDEWVMTVGRLEGKIQSILADKQAMERQVQQMQHALTQQAWLLQRDAWMREHLQGARAYAAASPWAPVAHGAPVVQWRAAQQVQTSAPQQARQSPPDAAQQWRHQQHNQVQPSVAQPATQQAQARGPTQQVLVMAAPAPTPAPTPASNVFWTAARALPLLGPILSFMLSGDEDQANEQ